MENQTNQHSKEKFRTQHYGAHSNCHAGLSDYNDGEYSFEENEEFDGTEAEGNDSEFAEEEDYGKYHSGL